MIARLQRWLMAVVAAMLMSSWLWAAQGGPLTLAVLLTLAATFSHVIVLLAELLAMRVINRRAGDPVPAWRDLLRAWVHESLVAPRVFCWRQPFFHRRWPDALDPPGPPRRGVLLVHGYACNRAVWNDWLAELGARGVPRIAVDLEPPWAGIEAYADIVERAVTRLQASTGLAPVVVAHSMGGLAVRAWLASTGNGERLHHLITLGSPHRGTVMAAFGIGTNVRQMRIGSPWLRALAASWPTGMGMRTSCFVAGCDNVVFPHRSAMLPGAAVLRVEACAHLELLSRREPFDALLRQLG